MPATNTDNFTKKLGENVKQLTKNILGEDNIQIISDNKLYFLFILMITIIFIIIGIYGYNNYVKPLINKNYVANKEFIDNTPGDDVLIYFFYTDWCPYCKKAKPEWEAFKDGVNNNAMYDSSYNIIFEEVDCDKNPGLANTYKVEGYPTIKLVYQEKTYDYDAKPDADNLIRFLDSSLKTKTSKKWFF